MVARVVLGSLPTNNRASCGHHTLRAVKTLSDAYLVAQNSEMGTFSDVMLSCSSWKRNPLNVAQMVFSSRLEGAGSKLTAAPRAPCSRHCSGSFETGHSKTASSISTEICLWRDHAMTHEHHAPRNTTRHDITHATLQNELAW